MSKGSYLYQGDITKFWKTIPQIEKPDNCWAPSDYFYCVDVNNNILGVIKRGDNTFLTISGITKYMTPVAVCAIRPILVAEYYKIYNLKEPGICFVEGPGGRLRATTVENAVRNNLYHSCFITTDSLYEACMKEAGMERLTEEAIEQCKSKAPSDKFIKVTSLERQLDISEPVYVLRGYKVEKGLFVENMLAVGSICEGPDDNSKSVEFQDDRDIPLESLYVRA